jgi:SAM-dependent methyltransferase
MDRREITEANRIAWNEAMPYHQKNRKIDLHQKFKEARASILDPVETEVLQSLGIRDKNVAHLCCNNGQELISIVNLGAKLGVGFDISDAAIQEAGELAEIANANCQFVRTDVYDIDPKWQNSFDLVYITIGALPWLPELDPFFEIAATLLKPGGLLVIYEGHPFTSLLALDDEPGYDRDNPYKIAYSYFKTEPWVENSGIDYYGNERYDGHVNYCYTHSLSKILNAVIKSGLNIRSFDEYPHDTSCQFGHLEHDKLIPLSYILVSEKLK